MNNTINKVKFDRKNLADFYPTVRKRVDTYFQNNGGQKHANAVMIGKTIFILAGFIITYALLLSNLFNPWVLLAIAATHGFFTALIGLNIAHDAIHGAYSSNATVNKLLGVCFNIVGANDHVWKIKHNIVHHTYTNIPGQDDDINQPGVIRMDPQMPLRPIHRFQHIYMFMLYPLASISWVFMKDYVNFFRKNLGGYDNSNYPKKEVIRLFAYKALYYVLFLIIPLMVISLPWYLILAGFFLMHFIEGFTMSIIFQLAHIVEGTDFPLPDKEGQMEHSWAVHQMYTTANFACKNPVVNFLFGGLNFQIEHHLFPKICHIHYSEISQIVRETAKEYNLPYIENETFTGAIKSHIRIMKKLGQPQAA